MEKRYVYDLCGNMTSSTDAEGLRHEMEKNGSLVQFIFNQDRYDYKFVINPGNNMSDKQIDKILTQGPAGLTKSDIHEVNPTN